MLAKLRSWWQKTSKPLDAVIVTVLVVLLALLVVIVLGYILNWSWTGLHGKTLYDWLQLLIIPAVLAVGGYLFNYTTGRNERQANEQRAQTERDIALDNQREAALQAYIDSMSELLLEKNLRKSSDDDEVRKIARVRTLTVLPRLDANRKRSVLQFLIESVLIDVYDPIINLGGADLSEVNLSETHLGRASLFGVDLSRSNLFGVNLSEANLSRSNLNGANLCIANLDGANLCGANLCGADLREAFLVKADLRARLRGANLSRTHLNEANLSRANLIEANLSGANLGGADLSEAMVSTVQLNQVKSLKGATMPDGTKHA